MNPTTSPLTDALRNRIESAMPSNAQPEDHAGVAEQYLDHAAAMESLARQLQEALEESISDIESQVMIAKRDAGFTLSAKAEEKHERLKARKLNCKAALERAKAMLGGGE
jgi:hypothetical protein